ncbi:MAG: hypothetical protein F9K29_23580 [Hyphomicrobiaceae bacterium]|nr:MAG: hypothetical protein F9K29_23580 [Hyphomicrobiaceae bacterium]
MTSRRLRRLAAAVGVSCSAYLLPAGVAEAQRTGTAPCRQGALALIAMLDGGEQTTPDYRKLAKSVVETCGPPAARKADAQGPTQIDQAVCRKLALAMLDAIEENKIAKKAFVDARDGFARSCVPR